MLWNHFNLMDYHRNFFEIETKYRIGTRSIIVRQNTQFRCQNSFLERSELKSSFVMLVDARFLQEYLESNSFGGRPHSGILRIGLNFDPIRPSGYSCPHVLGPLSLVTSVPIASTPIPHLCASSLVLQLCL